MDSSDDGGDEAPPGSPGAAAEFGSSRKPTARRNMKTPYQLEVLEQTYIEDPYPNKAKRVELSAKLGLTDRAAADVVLPPEAQGPHGTEPEKMELPHNPLCQRGECGDLRCTQLPILGLCSSRAGGAGGVCSSAPRVTKKSCPSSSTSMLTHHNLMKP